MSESSGILFGPIPSRRLGRSLGINNIPPKTCTYSCIYCQIGKTNSMAIHRQAFFSPDEILNEASERISTLRERGEVVDYLTFVPDGEPTLDIHLGETIEKLKVFGIKVAVITNSSLIWDRSVRSDLMKADWVSLKIDSTDEETWKRIDRPFGTLKLEDIQNGASDFSRTFKGTLVTETMLVKGINDSTHILQQVSSFVASLHPFKAYILVPTRPPAEAWVQAPDEERLNIAYQIFSERVDSVELLAYYEGTNFTLTGDVEKDLLDILAVHPMSHEAVREFIDKSGSGWNLMDRLMAGQIVKQVEYSGRLYYVRNLAVAHGEH